MNILRLALISSLVFISPLIFAGDTEFDDVPVKSLNEAERELLGKSGFGEQLQQYESQKDTGTVEQKTNTQSVVETQSTGFTPSMKIADDAFSKGDYKTALEHYEALGKQGDSRASMAAGLIHAEGGEGVDVDKARAAAWLKRSEGQGNSAGADLYDKMDYHDELSYEEQAKAEELIREFQENNSGDINTELSLPSPGQVAGSGLGYSYSRSSSTQFTPASRYVTPEIVESRFSPMRSASNEYSYQPVKVETGHYYPERE
ncbi:MAG: hypothetical protein MI865_08260 [Proteobacteria bacterium]|nr:hypothetical protein [Pseudomonadota bacterium]